MARFGNVHVSVCDVTRGHVPYIIMHVRGIDVLRNFIDVIYVTMDTDSWSQTLRLYTLINIPVVHRISVAEDPGSMC